MLAVAAIAASLITAVHTRPLWTGSRRRWMDPAAAARRFPTIRIPITTAVRVRASRTF